MRIFIFSLIVILLSSGVIVIFPEIYATETPSWIKEVAKWWINGQISDDEFKTNMKYLLERKIIDDLEFKKGKTILLDDKMNNLFVKSFLKHEVLYSSENILNVAIVGDVGLTQDSLRTLENIDSTNPEVIIFAGDLSYTNSTDWFDFSDFLGVDRIKVSLGNHELYNSGDWDPSWLSHYGIEKEFYSFDYESIHFVVLASDSKFLQNSDQIKFLEYDLKSAQDNSEVNWIIVIIHKPLYSSTPQIPIITSNMLSLRNNFQPLFDLYDVDLVIQGHQHAYERTNPLMYNSIITDNSVVSYVDPFGQIYVTVGTGGYGHHSYVDIEKWSIRQNIKDFGFLQIKLINDGDSISGEFVTNNGRIGDFFQINKFDEFYETVDLSGVDLSGRDLSRTMLVGANLTNANLSGAHLYGADLSWTNLSEVNLSGANLTKTILRGVDLTKVDLTKVDLMDADLGLSNLSGVDLSGRDLSRTMLVGANLTNANLSGAHLYGADLSWTNLSEVNLSGANLTKTILRGVDLTKVDLTKVDLMDADLGLSNLSGVDLSGRDLSRTMLVGANLTNANLSGAHLYGADLSWTNLSEVNLSGRDLSRTMLVGANLTNANLSGVTLTGMDLTNANLAGQDLSDHDLMDVIFTGADLSNSVLPDDGLSGKNFDNSILDGVDLSGKDLSYSDFRHTSFKNTNLQNTNFDHAEFLEVDLTKIKNKSLAGADLRSTAIVYSNLSGINLDGSILGFLNWQNSNLSEIDFTVISNKFIDSSVFIGANLSNTNFEGVIFNDKDEQGQMKYYKFIMIDGAYLANKSLSELSAELQYRKYFGSWVIEKKVDGNDLLLNTIHYNDFSLANLTKSSFLGSYLNFTNFSHADLSWSNLSRTHLGGANLEGANLEGADLSGANLGGTNLVNSNLDEINSKCINHLICD